MLDWIRTVFAARKTEPAKYEQHVHSWPVRSYAGPAIATAEQAFGVPEANAAGGLIARTVAMLPAHVLAARGADEADGNQRLRDHPVEAIFGRQANPETSGFRFRESLLLSTIFYGNAFAEVERTTAGGVFALWLLHPDRVSVCRDPDTSELYYEVTNDGGGKVAIPSADMLHLAGPSFSSPVGLSLISYARHALGLAVAQDQFAGSFVRNQAAPSGMLTVKGTIREEGLKRLRAEVEQMYTGAGRAGRVIIGDDAVDWKQIGVSPQDAQFLEMRRFSLEQIARIFGVPPQLIGDTSKATLNNYETAGLFFLQLAVLPWVTRLEQEINRKLFAEPIRGRARPFIKFNTAAVVRADLAKRYQAYGLGRQWGWLSVNDIRKLEDLEPIGEVGDAYLTPLNMQPSDAPAPSPEDVADEIDQRFAALIGRGSGHAG